MFGMVLAVGLLAGRQIQVTPEPASRPADPLVVYLMTMGPGEAIYERFGHNAIWVRDTVAGTDRIYNFGMFDFQQENFYWNFAKGRPRYWLDTWSLEGTMRVYSATRRTVEVQELALTAAQKADLAASLAFNANPENRTYTYDYYLDNCSTRVRDALDQVLGGALRRATEGVPGEGSFRFHTQRSTTNSPLMYLGILAAMGPRADDVVDQWAEMFLPEKVQDRVRELRVRDAAGREVPLVAREATLLEFADFRVEAAPPDWSWPLLGIGALLAVVMASGMLAGPAGVSGRILTAAWSVVVTLAGVLLAFLAGFTDHVMTSWNHNLFFFNPLALAVLILLYARHRRWLDVTAQYYLALVVLGAIGSLGVGVQDYREIAALVAVPSMTAVAVALAVSRRRGAAPPVPR